MKNIDKILPHKTPPDSPGDSITDLDGKMYELVEGDWVAKNYYDKNRKLICSKRDPGLTYKQIQRLKKNNIKKVLVKEGIPFVPAFFFGFLLTIFFSDYVLF